VWNVNVTTGSSKPAIGDQPGRLATIDLNDVSISSTGGGALTLGITDTDFLLTPGLFPTSSGYFSSTIGGVTGGTVAVGPSILDPGNASWATTGIILAGGAFGPGAFSQTFATKFAGSAVPGEFSLTSTVVVTHTAAGQITSFNNQLIAVVPEPGVVALLGMGLGVLFFTGVLARRREGRLN
jgi:hypothetical protein